MIKVVTLESLLNENDEFRTDAFDFENAMIEIVEESMNIDELMCETNTRIAAQTVAEEGFVTLEANGLKSAIKTVFSKIIEFLKKAVRFIIRIFEIPFILIRMIIGQKKSAKDINKWVCIAKSKTKIKTKATTFAKKFEDEVKKFKEQTKNDTDIIQDSGRELNVLEKEFEEICRINGVKSEDLEASINKLKLESVKRMEKIEKYCQSKTKYEKLNIPVDELSAKEGDIGQISTSILRQIKEYEASKGDCQKLETESKKILKDLEKLSSEVERIKEEGNLDSEYASTINKTLQIIRANITAIARRGGDISKWFRTANDIINGIERFGGALNHYVDTSNQFDEINGTPIYIVPDYLASQFGGAGAMMLSPKFLKMMSNISPEDFGLPIDSKKYDEVNSDKSLDSNPIYQAINDGDKISVIIISEEIAGWKSSKPSWYNFIIGHESGHIMNGDHSRNKLDPSTTANNTTTKYNGSEAMADRVGMNISGITESEKKEIAQHLYKTASKAIDDSGVDMILGKEAANSAKLNIAIALKTRFSIASI